MKFFSIALAAVLAGVTTAKQQLTGKVIEQRLRSGKFDKKMLMASARPYNRRQLDGEDADQEFEPTADYSVHFDSCVALKIKDDNLLDEGYYDYAYEGSLVSEKSYVIFSMCYSNNCYYDAEDGSNSYIVDVGTFVGALSNYLPNQRDNFCQQCERNQDYCLGNYENQDQDDADDADDAADDADERDDEDDREEEDDKDEGDQGRRLKQVNYIDCDLCQEYECFEVEQEDGYEEEEQIDYDAAMQWIEGLAECYQTEYQMNNANLYAGFLCNSYGTGIEIGVFLDNDCTLYTTKESFKNIMSDDDANYYSKASELIQHMFTTDISCAQDNTEYTNPYDNEGADEDDADEEEEGEVGEWCQNLFEDDTQSLYNCNVEEEEEEDQNNDEDNWANVAWYSWDVSGDDAEDAAKVCQIIQQFDGEYSGHNVYDQKNSGTLFDYSKKRDTGRKNVSNGGLAVIIIVLIIAVAGGAAWAFGGSKKTDKKRTPLINGQMA